MFAPETRILVIDDMPSIRDLVKNTLKAMGYKNLQEAGDGEEGLKILMQSNTVGSNIQLVISDWNMPKMKGLELLKQVRATAEWANLPFVLLTSESERDQVTEAVLAGVSQYIVKPFSAKIFEDKLKAAWAKHNPPK
jgi:two-component system chemotaxis response regulator CheY